MNREAVAICALMTSVFLWFGASAWSSRYPNMDVLAMAEGEFTGFMMALIALLIALLIGTLYFLLKED
jgi:hypothetical protein